jgi:hypothetical protein
VVNIFSTASWLNLPLLPGCSVSKVGASSPTRGLRAHLANRGVRVREAFVPSQPWVMSVSTTPTTAANSNLRKM